MGDNGAGVTVFLGRLVAVVISVAVGMPIAAGLDVGSSSSKLLQAPSSSITLTETRILRETIFIDLSENFDLLRVL